MWTSARWISYAVLMLVSVPTLEAQTRSRLSVEPTYGVGYGRTSGDYLDKTTEGLALDVLLGLRLRSSAGPGVVAAASVGIHGAGAHYTICRLRPDGTCVPAFPDFTIVAALLGWEDNPNTTFRVMGGPAYFHGKTNAFGLQTRADYAAPLLWRVSFMFSGRASFIPDYQGDAFQLASLGIGLRVR